MHIGHAYENILADFLARYYRQQGNKVIFQTGTDDHGLKNYKSAKEEGISTKKFVDKHAKNVEEVFKSISSSHDQFVRTVDSKKHWPGVQKLWKAISKDLYKKKYTAKYCVGCENFLLAKEIVKGCCEIHPGKQLEIISEENYFFKLSDYKEKLITLIKSDKYKIQPKAAKNEILSFLKNDLRDVSFSREKSRLPWGIPVPGDKKQVMYVWADALPNYITGVGYGSNSNKFKKWWPAQTHIIGKDISRFHAIYWPAMLLSAGLATPKELLVHGFINDKKGRKMSKSIGNVIDPFDQINTYGLDTVRYYFLRSIPSNQDGNYSEEDLIDRHNTELVNTLGNLLSRSLNLIEKSGGKVPSGKFDISLKKEYTQALKNLNESVTNFDFHHGIASVWKFIAKVNQYVDKTKPWTLDGKKKEKVLYNLAESLRLISALTYPIIPNASEEIAKQLGIKKVPLIKSASIKVGTKIKKGKHLFSKI